MKRFKGILGASLAGFAALTMAAITSTAPSEALAFRGSRVRVQAPTHMRSMSHVQSQTVRRSPARSCPPRTLSFGTVGKRRSAESAVRRAAGVVPAKRRPAESIMKQNLAGRFSRRPGNADSKTRSKALDDKVKSIRLVLNKIDVAQKDLEANGTTPQIDSELAHRMSKYIGNKFNPVGAGSRRVAGPGEAFNPSDHGMSDQMRQAQQDKLEHDLRKTYELLSDLMKQFHDMQMPSIRNVR